MPEYRWDKEKNEYIKITRNISFEEIVKSIYDNGVVKNGEHYNKDRYPNQRIMYVWVNTYIYVVPYVIQLNGDLFLKTAYPCRKAKKHYEKQKKEL